VDAYYHLAFVVPDLDAAAAEMGALFGVTWQEPRTTSHEVRLGDGRVIHRESTSVWSVGFPAIQLMLARDGSPEVRLHHVGRFVDDLPAAVRDLEASGHPLTMTRATEDGVAAGFAMHGTPFGFEVELVAGGPRSGGGLAVDEGPEQLA
jgi:hypothetical protein